jgi:uncharacterized protein
MTPPPTPALLRTITLEEHYATAAFLDGPGRQLRDQAQAARDHPLVAARFTRIVEQLCDLDQRRLADMDAAGIDLQVLSLTAPGVEQLDAAEAVALAHDSNDLLVAAVRRQPKRFGGFAALPIQAPETAAKELKRMVHEQGFKGALINGHTRGRYLDDTFFWPILECAAALQVPLYLHPTTPPQAVIAASYTGNFAPAVTSLLANAAWGWHLETGTHVLRLILSGVFDRYPTLQVVVGHLGEGLPFMLPRLEATLAKEVTKLERPLSAYLRENLHYTISGFNFLPTFLDLFLEVGAERIMFSADYPYASMEKARAFLEQLPVSPADRARIAYGNAERLLPR